MALHIQQTLPNTHGVSTASSVLWYNRVDILGLMGCTENLQEDLSFQCVYMNLFSDHLKGFNEVNLPEPL